MGHQIQTAPGETFPPAEKPADSPVDMLEIDVESPHDSIEVLNYLKGWPLHSLTISLCLALFLPNVESTITATSLVAIANDLDGFNKSTWVVTSYLLTYTGFLIIWAKLSDIFGWKPILMISLALLIAFSGACSAAQTMTQLIILRAFQGIGASGTYSLIIVMFFELVPPEKFATYTSMISGVLAIGIVIGPLFGGVINNFTTWRWVFLFAVILGAVGAVLLSVTIPRKFPYHGMDEGELMLRRPADNLSRKAIKRVDFVGATLLLSATIFIVTVLEETGFDYKWKSPFAIVLLIASIFSWVLFIVWSWKVTTTDGVVEPVFPWRFMQSRVAIGLILCVFFTGAPLTTAIIQIPLRFQIINGLSPLNAAIRLLPFAVLVPVGSVWTAGIAGKFKVPPAYLFMAASALQTVGFALLSTSPTDGRIISAQYGYQVICGFAIGGVLSTLTLMAPFSVEARDKSVAMSAQLQFRLLGGAIGLSISTAVMNSYLKSHLEGYLTPEQINDVLKSAKNIGSLPPDVLDVIFKALAEGYNLQMKVMVGFSAVQVPLGFLLWKKKQILV